MNIILLSGGSGTRLWPLSNDIRSKQFIKIFKNKEGLYESMLQRAYKEIKKINGKNNIVIATSKSQVSIIHNQLGKEVNLSIEPCRKDTFPAILLATLYFRDVLMVPKDEPVVVCPVDAFVDPSYFTKLVDLANRVKQGSASVVLMGIEPTYPSEKYGYIIPENNEDYSRVIQFTEKPSKEWAEKYINAGALWNAGIFAYKLEYLIEKAGKIGEKINYDLLRNAYGLLEKISFDYAVLEKENNIEVLRYKDSWKDIGTWNTLTESMDEQVIGEAILNETCQNVHVINEIGLPILAMGLEDVVIAASPQGILVTDKEQSSYIKPFVEQIDNKIMFAEKSWGSYRVIDIGERSLTIRVTLNAGHSMNYHSHKNRDEVWVVTEGEGVAIVDGVENLLTSGDVVSMEAECKHTIIAKTELHLVEVQLGQDIDVYDKEKFALE